MNKTYKLLHYIDLPEDVNIDDFNEEFIDLVEKYNGTTFGIVKESEQSLYNEEV